MPLPAFDVASYRDADDDRAGPDPLAASSHGWHFIPNLHECRPHVVGKLNLDDRFVSRDGHSSGNADDACLGQRTVAHTVGIGGAMRDQTSLAPAF